MHCELPVFRRCCFFLPLRRGVLAFCYLNIILCILDLLLMIVSQGYLKLHRAYLQMALELNITLTVLDIVASFVLIVGLHMKRVLLVKIYYYFMFFSMSAAVPLIIINAALIEYKQFTTTTMLFFFFFYTVINLYLLLLVRSLIRKLQFSNGNIFGNQMAEFVEGSPTDAGPAVTITIRDENDIAKADQ